MCDPMTLMGIALSGGSALATHLANRSVETARSGVVASENSRQQRLQSEASTVNQQTRQSFQDFDTGREKSQQELQDFFVPNQPSAASAPALPASTSDIVVREQAVQEKSIGDRRNQDAAGLANVRSFGDLMGSLNLNQARGASEVNQLGSFMRGSSNVVPLELQHANTAGDGAKMWADILGGSGSLMTGAGLTGGTFPTFQSPYAALGALY